MARTWVVVVIATMSSMGRAAAAPIAVGTVHVNGTSGIAASLRASVNGGLASAGQETVSAHAVDEALATTPAIASCDTDVCLAKLAELVHARGAVRATVEVLGSSNYTFRLELIDAASARTVARVDDNCAICTSREANEAISRAAAALAKKIPSPTPSPSPTPPSPAPSPSPSPSPLGRPSLKARLLLGFGITATILGAGAISGGSALIALDGRTRMDGTDPVTHDPLQSTFAGKVPGAILVAAGDLLVIGGSLMLWRARVERHRAH